MFNITANQKETMEREDISQVIQVSGTSIVVGQTIDPNDTDTFFIHLDDGPEPIYMNALEARILALSLLNMVGI